MDIKNFTDTELLQELISRNKQAPAPTKTERFGVWFESIIGIGNDNIASICIDDGALQALNKINKG